MSTERDTTTTLNSGTGGDSLDESNILEADFATGAAPVSVGKRPRVVIGGEMSRDALIEPMREGDGYALPVVDMEARAMLAEILECDQRIVELLEAFVSAALSKP